MVSEILYNNPENSNLTIWQLSVGSMFCMCCVVFFGLKFKWFRAQLRLNDPPSKNISNSSVQGLGFKMTSTTEDYQVYQVTSEFAPLTNDNRDNMAQQSIVQNKNINFGPNITQQQLSNNNSTNVNQNSSETKNSEKQNNISKTKENDVFKTVQSAKQNNTAKTNEKTKPNSSIARTNEGAKQNSTPKTNERVKQNSTANTNEGAKQKDIAKTNESAKPRSTARTAEIDKQLKEEENKTEIKPILKNENTNKREHKNSVNFDPETTEISNPSAQKFSDLIKNPLKQQTTDAQTQPQPVANQNLQIKNPLATNNFMPLENEDEWKIKIIDEKPKPETEKEDNVRAVISDNSVSSGLYSSQAASIFFGGQPSGPQPQPRARKFVEYEEDNNSIGSQTSA